MHEQLSLNIWSIISFIIAGQGLFLLTLIFSKKEAHLLDKSLLGGLVGAFSLMLIYYALYWSGIHLTIHRIFSIPLSFNWAIGPISYLLVLRLSRRNISGKHWWHFAPLFFFLLLRISTIYSPFFRSSLQNTFINGWLIIAVIQLAQMIAYSLLIFQQQQKNEQYTEWGNVIFISFATYTFGNVAYYLLVWSGSLSPSMDYFITLIMACSIYLNGYYSYKKQPIHKINRPEGKYANSMLSPQVATALMKKLNVQLAEQKIYLDHSLNLERLSNEIGVSKHQASQLINQEFGSNFFDLINKYRIDHAKSILEDKGTTSLKINQLATIAGFNNKVTFNNAFKKFTGMTPTEYRNTFQKVKL